MREIKFRAWTESDKSMTRPLDIGIPDEAEAIRYYGIGQKSGLSILEQFTGLRDKNGKEIYEGDILRCFPDKSNYIVFYIDNEAMFTARSLLYMYLKTKYWIDSEVIGNIHENIDLLR